MLWKLSQNAWPSPALSAMSNALNVEDRAMAALIVFSIIASGIAALSVAVWMGVDLDRRT
jgi:predicted benzoate:H+ symporter BenE